MKKLLALLMVLAMLLSITACSGSGSESSTESTETSTTAAEEAEEEAEEEAALTIADMTEEEILAAMQEEPAWGTTIYAEYDGGDCTCGPAMALYLGYFDQWGLDVEIIAGTEITEALGTNKAQLGVNHIAHMLVPITNGMDIVFTGTAQTGCQSLYILADSEYTSVADLVGTTVGISSSIGGSSHNMAIRFCLAEGIDPSDITFVQVDTSACIQAMQNGEISAMLMSDRYAKAFVDDGTIQYLRSITWDEDFSWECCCVLAMNGSFVEENPVIAQVLTQCVMDAYMYMYENKEEVAQILLDEGYVSGSYELTLYMLEQQDWSVSYEVGEETIRLVAEDYISAGIIDASWTVEEVMAAAWNPLGTKG